MKSPNTTNPAMHRATSTLVRVTLLCASLLAGSMPHMAAASADAAFERRLETLERAIAADPEALALGADYRRLTIEAGLFNRAIDLFRRLAKRKGSGPNVKISLALAIVDKVPVVGSIRRLYLGREAIDILTQSIAERPSVLAYYVRGLINLYYNRLIFHRTDKGIADLMQALSLVTRDTPSTLVARVYMSLGDGYVRLEDVAKARQVWLEGAAKFPDDIEMGRRLGAQGQALAEIVARALAEELRADTSLTGLLPLR